MKKDTLIYNKLIKKVLIIAGISGLVIGLLIMVLVSINNFYKDNYLEFRSPIQSPIVVKARQLPQNSEIEEEEVSIFPNTQVYASEPVSIEQKIKNVFGDVYEEAIIIARCESQLDPSKIGDKNLLVYNGDDIVGDSIGLFQIRTGGVDFNRARANNMTPDEFRQKMLNVDENIKYAKQIYDRDGWNQWTCKKDL